LFWWCGGWEATGAALVAAITLAVPSDGWTQESPQREYDPIQIPSGGRPIAIERAADIPRQLTAAIDHAQCRADDAALKERPLLIFRPADGYRVMAVAPCKAIVPYSRAFMFEATVQSQPMPMTFPVIAPIGGFSASDMPGLMDWNAETRMLTAWKGSDHCSARETRHTYHHGHGDLNGFALVKVESREYRCAAPEADWKVIWQAAPWNLQ
jgi:hypothetical protein